MKLGITILFLVFASIANSQSLKDMLYKGKLKKDSSTVIRKTDDLSTKMVDTTKKAIETVQVDTLAIIADSATVRAIQTGNPVPPSAEIISIDSNSVVAYETVVAPAAAPVKSNNRIWKEHTDSLATIMKTEVLSNKKVKKETYFLTVDYEISAEGEVSILNVMSSPENDFLANQVKDRLISATPILAPATDGSGKARKVKRKYNFSITKD